MAVQTQTVNQQTLPNSEHNSPFVVPLPLTSMNVYISSVFRVFVENKKKKPSVYRTLKLFQPIEHRGNNESPPSINKQNTRNFVRPYNTPAAPLLRIN